MDTISYLREIYGYSVPIFLKDIRIGGKSKSAIRKELSRAVDKKEIVRDSNGVYYFIPNHEFPKTISFEEVLEKKFVCDNHGVQGFDLDVYGYYSGLTFLNQLGISQQVPAVIEVVTNNTSCKRIFTYNGFRALLRKGKTTIDYHNYKALQFFDAFYLLESYEIKEHYQLLYNYIRENLSRSDFEKYINLYPTRIIKLIVEGGLINAFR